MNNIAEHIKLGDLVATELYGYPKGWQIGIYLGEASVEDKKFLGIAETLIIYKVMWFTEEKGTNSPSYYSDETLRRIRQKYFSMLIDATTLSHDTK